MGWLLYWRQYRDAGNSDGAKGRQGLDRFLEDASLPLDNNASEGALRTVALGRKNYVFVGHGEAGADIAGLYSLFASCQANDVNSEAYLGDVLLQVQSTPGSQIDELLPRRRSPTRPSPL